MVTAPMFIAKMYGGQEEPGKQYILLTLTIKKIRNEETKNNRIDIHAYCNTIKL